MARLLLLASVGLALAVGLASAPAPPVEAQVELVSGTLSMSNSRDGAAILTAAGMAPGDSRSGDVTIANTGDLTGTFSLSKSNLGDTPGPFGGALSSALDLVVEDVTNPAAPATVYAGKLAAMAPRPLGDWAPGTARTFRFTLSFPDTSGDNAYQSSAVSVRFDWHATADEPPSDGGGGVPTPTPRPAPAPGGGADTVAPNLTLTGKKRQRLIRQRGLVVFVQSDEPVSLSAGAKGAKPLRKVKLSPWRGQTMPGARVKIKLKLSKKAMKTAKRAMVAANRATAVKKRRKRPNMTVMVRAIDGAGNAAMRRLKISLR
jgi:spore coat-associated protein N